jgi:circadian clock protein KaiB
MVIATYRSLFPQLWEDHDLILRFERLATKPQLGLMYPSNENAMLETGLSYHSRVSTHAGKKRHYQDTATPFNKALPSALDEHQHPEKLSYVFRLFVAGNSAGTERILKTLKKLLDESLTHPYTLKVVDVFKHPDRAEADQVSATPTLVKVSPLPIRRLVGNLDNVEKVLHVLGSLED